MDIGPALLDYLVEFYNEDQIRSFWKEAGDALASRSTCLIHITGTSFQGQSSNGINLATPAEQAAFMTLCKQALAQISGVAATIRPEQLATGIDYSYRPVMV